MNDALQITTGLRLTAAVNPEIGGGPSTATTGFTEGHLGSDQSFSITSDSVGTVIAGPLTRKALVRVVASGANVLLGLVDASDVGIVPAGASVLIPLTVDAQLQAFLATAGTPATVGVTVVEWTDNS